jgi:hypothetical protein
MFVSLPTCEFFTSTSDDAITFLESTRSLFYEAGGAYCLLFFISLLYKSHRAFPDGLSPPPLYLSWTSASRIMHAISTMASSSSALRELRERRISTIASSSSALRELRERKELEYDEDKKMWAAIKGLIRKMDDSKISQSENRKEINTVQKGAKNIYAKEIADIVHLRKTGSSVNSALILHRAVRMPGCNETVVNLLLRLSADLNQQDESGRTPLHIAAEYNSALVPFLVQMSANIRIKDCKGKTALDICADHWSRFVDSYSYRHDRIYLSSFDTNKHLAAVNALMTSSQKKFLEDDWISPRMEYKLFHFAEIGGDSFLHGYDNLICINEKLATLTGNQRFIDGYILCFSAAASLLRRGFAPTVERIEKLLLSVRCLVQQLH